MPRPEPGASMRLPAPRMEPVDVDEYTSVVTEMGGAPPRSEPLNVTRLWARHPPLMRALRPLQSYLLLESSLDRRDVELAVLRVGWLCCSAYELAQHAMFGLKAGLDEAELRRVTEGPDAPGWTTHEATLLRAVDEMIGDAFISEATWEALTTHYSEVQMLDLMSVVGRYFTVSIILNSSGLQLEPDRIPFDHYLDQTGLDQTGLDQTGLDQNGAATSGATQGATT